VVFGNTVKVAKRQRVLVVDDHADTADILVEMVGCLGHDARAANNGRDALLVARDFAPQLVLLDLQLPDASGYDLIRGLRPAYIAAITCWGRDEDRMRSYDAGLDQHVVKPLDLRKLREILALAAADG
jgi:DNA-binding response OmpR family regulator